MKIHWLFLIEEKTPFLKFIQQHLWLLASLQNLEQRYEEMENRGAETLMH